MNEVDDYDGHDAMCMNLNSADESPARGDTDDTLIHSSSNAVQSKSKERLKCLLTTLEFFVLVCIYVTLGCMFVLPFLTFRDVTLRIGEGRSYLRFTIALATRSGAWFMGACIAIGKSRRCFAQSRHANRQLLYSLPICCVLAGLANSTTLWLDALAVSWFLVGACGAIFDVGATQRGLIGTPNAFRTRTSSRLRTAALCFYLGVLLTPFVINFVTLHGTQEGVNPVRRCANSSELLVTQTFNTVSRHRRSPEDYSTSSVTPDNTTAPLFELADNFSTTSTPINNMNTTVTTQATSKPKKPNRTGGNGIDADADGTNLAKELKKVLPKLPDSKDDEYKTTSTAQETTSQETNCTHLLQLHAGMSNNLTPSRRLGGNGIDADGTNLAKELKKLLPMPCYIATSTVPSTGSSTGTTSTPSRKLLETPLRNVTYWFTFIDFLRPPSFYGVTHLKEAEGWTKAFNGNPYGFVSFVLCVLGILYLSSIKYSPVEKQYPAEETPLRNASSFVASLVSVASGFLVGLILLCVFALEAVVCTLFASQFRECNWTASLFGIDVYYPWLLYWSLFIVARVLCIVLLFAPRRATNVNASDENDETECWRRCSKADKPSDRTLLFTAVILLVSTSCVNVIEMTREISDWIILTVVSICHGAMLPLFCSSHAASLFGQSIQGNANDWRSVLRACAHVLAANCGYVVGFVVSVCVLDTAGPEISLRLVASAFGIMLSAAVLLHRVMLSIRRYCDKIMPGTNDQTTRFGIRSSKWTALREQDA